MRQVLNFVLDAGVALLVLALAMQATGLLAVAGVVLFILNALSILLKVFGYKTAVLTPDGKVSSILEYQASGKE